MSINLTQNQINLALPKVTIGLKKYLSIQNKISSKPFDNPEFRKEFNGFYRIQRRSSEWYDAFYSLMKDTADADQDNRTFEKVFKQFCDSQNRYEASFISKMVATFNPHKPVIDKFVLKNLGLKLPYYGAKNKFSIICDIYQKIDDEFQQYLQTQNGKYLVEKFNECYPDASHIANEKKLDLILWQSR